MPSFKQKNVIKSYKLRLQKKFQTVTEETKAATAFLNNCLIKFKTRVDEILEIKDKKYLSLYNDLARDLERFSEKLFILQDSLEGSNDDSSQNDGDSDSESDSTPPTDESVKEPELQNNQVISESPLQQDVEESTPDVEESTAPSFDAQPGSSESSLSVQNSSSLPQVSSISDQPDTNNKSHTENYYDCESVGEDDFRSLRSDIQNSSNAALSEIVKNSFHSTQSFSQSSCYRSVSSTISEPLVQAHVVKVRQSNQSIAEINIESTRFPLLVISTPAIQVPSKVSGTLSFIVNPGDFWIQLESSHSSGIMYSTSENSHMFGRINSIKKGDYCLAPFRSGQFYYRAQSLSDANLDHETVKVHYIDHGSTRELALFCLRHLPFPAYDVPCQAIHCYLEGIVHKDGCWSEESIEKFKYFRDFCIDVHVKHKDSLYAVQLIAKASEDLNEDFSVDVAQELCFDGFAISKNDSLLQSPSVRPKCPDSKLCPASKDIDSPFELSSTTAISNDSGVSVSSTYNKSSQNISKESSQFSRDNIPKLSFVDDSYKNKYNFSYESNTKNDDSFKSVNSLNLTNADRVPPLSESANYLCIMCKSNNFCLHLNIPPADLVFFEQNMMIVMPSHIVDLSEFYVNVAMENIVNLDELREHMTATYNSQRNDVPNVRIDDLFENMFLAGFFHEDNHWYRVRILKIKSEDKRRNEVLVQYVDYGNTAIIKCSDLLPLSPEFSQYSVFAIKCSLAGLVPVDESSGQKVSSGLPRWSEDAISAFKQLTSFERCLTAQVCNGSDTDSYTSTNIPVLLWDMEDGKDILINHVLAEMKFAIFEATISQVEEPKNSVGNTQESDILNAWDPMAEEYNSIQNSYTMGEDIEEVITGYKAKDETYSCKYFALRGSCPLGDRCQYEHLPLLECGVTRDQEEVYCFSQRDILQLLPDNAVHILVQVSTVINPGHFYIILPYGCKTVGKIDELAKTGSSYEKIENTEAKELFRALDKHYSDEHFQENTGLALSPGTIVVAKRKADKQFHRGRVIDSSDTNEPYKVFFVDSGISEWVPRKFIRTIAPQFLHTPFQAIQCSLYGVQPIKSEACKWQTDAVDCFKNAVDGEVLLAEIIHRSTERLHLTLRKTAEHDRRKIDRLLISKGFAKECSYIPSAKKESQYVPG